MACVIELKYKKNDGTEVNKTFSSLDALYIELNTEEYQELRNTIFLPDSEKDLPIIRFRTVSRDFQKSIEDIEIAVKNAPKNKDSKNTTYIDGDFELHEESRDYIANAYHVTSLINMPFASSNGNVRTLSDPYGRNTNLSRTEMYKSWHTRYHKNFNTEEETKKAYDKWVKLNTWSTEVGTYIHKCLEILVKAKTENLFDSVSRPIPNSTLNLSENILEENWQKAKNLVNQIWEKHKGATFFPEFKIISKNIPSSLKDNINAQTKQSCDYITGSIDLLVKDTDGTVTIYDFKTSRNNVENWNYQTKAAYACQLRTYASILSQYGINVSDLHCKFIPIHYQLQKDEFEQPLSNILEIEYTDIDQLPTVSNFKSRDWSSIVSKLNSWFPSEFKTDLKGFNEKTQKIINAISMKTSVSSDEKTEIEKSNRERLRAIYLRKVLNSDEYAGSYKYYIDANKAKIDIDEIGIIGDIIGNRVYIKEDNIDEKFDKFINVFTKTRSEDNINFGHNLRDACLDGTSESLQAFLEDRSIRKEQRGWMDAIFRPYIKNGWTVVSDDNLLNQGILILKSGEGVETKFDIMMLSKDNLSYQYDLGRGTVDAHRTTVCGKFVTDTEPGIDKKYILSATEGHMLLMNAMAFISNNLDYFKTGKIRSIRAINTSFTQHTFVSNKIIQNSWKYIMAMNKLKNTAGNLDITGVPSDIFMNDAEADLDIAEDLIFTNSGTVGEMYQNKKDRVTSDGEYQIEKILTEMITYLSPKVYKNGKKQILPETSYSLDESAEQYDNQIALAYLSRALLATRGKYINWERDISKTLADFKAPAMSESANVRTVNDMLSVFTKTVRDDFAERAKKWRKLLDAVYTKLGFNRTLGNEDKLVFNRWFVKDSQGNVDFNKMELIDPSECETIEEREALKFFREQMTEFYTDETDIDDYDASKCPLVKGGTLERWYNGSFWGVIKENTKELFDLTISPIKNELEDPQYRVWLTGEDKRAEQLETHSKGYYSTNADYILLHTMQQQLRKKWIREFTPLFTSVQTVMAYMNLVESGYDDVGGSYTNNTMLNIQNFINDYIKARVHGDLLINDDLARLYQFLQKLTGLTSLVQLGFNSRAFARELITSFSISFTRSNDNVLPGINKTNFIQAIENIMSSSDQFKLGGLLHEQNLWFGMANLDLSQLADFAKTNKWNPHNWSRSHAFITASLPDLYFRNFILQAALIADRTDKAYYIDEDGVYSYHFDKDPRFFALKTANPTSKEYQEAVVRYNSIVDDLFTNQKDWLWAYSTSHPDRNINFKPITTVEEARNALPLIDGYTSAEIAGIRNATDYFFGHYNEENVMLFKEKFFGHFLLQYRTFLSSRLEQYFLQPGATNIVRYRTTMSDEKQALWIVIREDENGNEVPMFTWFNDLTEEELKNNKAKPLITTYGVQEEGMLTSTAGCMTALYKWAKEGDDTAFRTWWENPLHRSLLLMLFMDNLVTMIAMLFVNIFYGNDANIKYNSMKNSEWFKRWTYGVVSGALQDGPIFQILGQINSLNPPVITQLANWYEDSINVITGKDNFAHVLVDNIGMTREFSHYFDFNL